MMNQVNSLRLNSVLLLAAGCRSSAARTGGSRRRELQPQLKMCSALLLEFVYMLLLYLVRAAGRVVI